MKKLIILSLAILMLAVPQLPAAWSGDLDTVELWNNVYDSATKSIKTTGTVSISAPVTAVTTGGDEIANEATLELVRLLLASLDGKDYATQTTLLTMATEVKLEAVRVLLASLDGKDYATQTTLATLATETKLEAVRLLLASLDGKDYATQTTLAAQFAAQATAANQTTGNTNTGTTATNTGTTATNTGNTDTNTAAIELNTDTGTGVDHGTVTVGNTATLIIAASATRRKVTIINSFTDLVAVGNSDVTLNSVDATDGFVLAVSGAASDGTGGAITIETTAAVYGIGASASSEVIYFTESD